ncbi:MAG: sulfurtransferase [Paenibacillus sp.]|jgi:rhodanese-related sulfurtransferase|nr:sulfurtransferase [Paenibacillus sp.]
MDTSTLINILIIILIIWFVYRQFAPVKGVRSIGSKEFEQVQKFNRDAILIDVREPHEFKSGHIPSAKNLPLSQLKTRINEVPKNKSVFVYCQSGMRSKRAAVLLRKRAGSCRGTAFELESAIRSYYRTSAPFRERFGHQVTLSPFTPDRTCITRYTEFQKKRKNECLPVAF